MKKILYLLPVFVLLGCKDPDNPLGARFNKNGCLECDNYLAGDEFILGGVKYIVADRPLIENAIADGDELTRYCTSRITDMSELFYSNYSFNKDIGNWDVKNVTDMSSMFHSALTFNKSIANWDVSNVSNMKYMFSDAKKFNQDIGGWDVSKVGNMTRMFSGASVFNQNLSKWCVANFPTMPEYFSTASSLNASNLPVWGTCP